MRHSMRATQVFALAFAAMLAVVACSPSGGPAPGQIAVTDAWSMATPPGADVGAGYMTIRNGSPAAARLIGGETPAAASVEVHMMSMEGGVMQMRRMAEGLEIPASGEVELKPGGFHLMLIGLKAPLTEGESVPLTLIFEGGARVETTLGVRAMGSGHGH